ncbi:transmembrane protein [Cystoisospora suis]|uniref:Transmembrane protein n=1 Tax=Cystoisospora suis TaxID=483139 RepID=A0A2C6KG23_9APIC|nr:transmembrane protein [Cystoisospora suis]
MDGTVEASAAAFEAAAGTLEDGGTSAEAAARPGSASAPLVALTARTASSEKRHNSQQDAPLLKGEERTEGSEAVDDVSLGVGTEYDQKTNNDITLVLIAFILSFVCPPIGCIAFCFSLGYPENSRRYYWAVRALEVGSLLSFLYSLLLVMLLSDLKLVYTQNDKAHFGVGF